MVNAGYDNYINEEKVITVVDFSDAKSMPVKRAVREARDNGFLIDITMGRVTRSVIFTETGYIIISAVSGPIITKRIQEAQNACKEKEKISR